jgi:glycosyltransferase involved in cell wall biosynthesis
MLPQHGWKAVECTPPAGATTRDTSTDPRAAALAARRAKVMGAAGRLLDPAARLLRLQPEALAPNNLWAITGRSAVRKAIEREGPDVVVATAPPPSALLAASGAIGQVPFVAEFRDLWAGNPYFDRGSRALAKLEAHALAKAGAIVTVTDGCRDNLLRVHPEIGRRLHVLTNGFDPVLMERRSERRPAEPATLIHAGALYGDRTAEQLVAALGRPELQGRARLRLVGMVDPRTRRALQESPRLDALVEAPVSWEAAVDRAVAADIVVVINAPGTGGDMALPTKLYEALALGRPVLALTGKRSDSARLLERLGLEAGLAPPDDPAAIAAAIERLLAEPPPPATPESLAEFDVERIAVRYAELLDEVASRSSSSSSLGTTTSRR